MRNSHSSSCEQQDVVRTLVRKLHGDWSLFYPEYMLLGSGAGGRKMVCSVLTVQGICCASEVRAATLLALVRLVETLGASASPTHWVRAHRGRRRKARLRPRAVGRRQKPVVENTLLLQEGVEQVHVDVLQRQAMVTHDLRTSPEAMVRALNRLGLKAALLSKEEPGATVSTTLFVDGICCASEVPVIEKSLYALTTVQLVTVNVHTKTAIVVHTSDMKPELLSTKLNTLGLNASVLATSMPGEEAIAVAAPYVAPRRFPTPRLTLACVFWLVSLLHYVPGWHHLHYVAMGAILLCLQSVLVRAYGALLQFRLDINLLMSLAVVGAVVIGEYAEGAAVLVLFNLSHWLETLSSERARAALAAIIALRPDTATLHATGEELPVESVAVGCVLAVKSGARIPIDGVVLSGASTVDEAALTGESRPVEKSVGDAVSAGTVNVGGGFFTMETTVLSKDSAVARLVQLVQVAQTMRSPTEKMVETVARWYTPAVVALAALLASIPWAISHDVGQHYFKLALVFLVVACPCALVISTPITYVCGMARLARNGVLVKGGVHLETLGAMRTLCMDKTGTLTQGDFALVRLEMLGALTRREVLALLAALEQQSTHPMAAALCAAAANEGVAAAAAEVEGFDTIAGTGALGTVAGRVIAVGNEKMGAHVGCVPPPMEAEWTVGGGTVGWLWVDSVVTAAFVCTDAVRDEAAEAVQMLHALHVRTVMLTGDNLTAANAIQSVTGVQVRRQSLPHALV